MVAGWKLKDMENLQSLLQLACRHYQSTFIQLVADQEEGNDCFSWLDSILEKCYFNLAIAEGGLLMIFDPDNSAKYHHSCLIELDAVFGINEDMIRKSSTATVTCNEDEDVINIFRLYFISLMVCLISRE